MKSAELKQVFAGALNVPLEAITDTLTYREIAAWDSVTHMVLVSAIEGKWHVLLDTTEIVDLDSFAAAKRTLARHGVAWDD